LLTILSLAGGSGVAVLTLTGSQQETIYLLRSPERAERARQEH
jgi:hypothetical protein